MEEGTHFLHPKRGGRTGGKGRGPNLRDLFAELYREKKKGRVWKRGGGDLKNTRSWEANILIRTE